MSLTRNQVLALKLKKISPSIIYGIGVFTTVFYFYNIIGLAIGVLYFIFMKNIWWKRFGLILAWTTGISTMIIVIAGLINSLGAPSISTTYLAIILGPSTIIGFVVVFSLWKKKRIKRGLDFRILKREFTPKIKRLLVLLIILLPMIQWSSVNVNFRVLFDNSPKLLWIHAPTTVKNGTDFDVSVQAWDFCERLSAIYKGNVQFSLKSYNLTTFEEIQSVEAVLPESYTFTGQFFGSDMAYSINDGKDNGKHTFICNIKTIGIHYILVNDSITKNIYWSNPIIVEDYSESDFKIYWGDIHTHSALSDGSGSPEHHYYYARYIAGLDFCALTDHGETMSIIPGGLNHLEHATNTAYEEGNFVTFQGIEWTNAETGHYTCIFSGSNLIKSPKISFMLLPTNEQLWNALDDFTDSTGCKALALPHHTTKQEYIQDWTYLNPKYVKIAEVVSTHGECLFEQRDPLNYIGCGDPPKEKTNGSAIMDAFKMGYRLGLYASSDEHDGHPGHSLSHTMAYVSHQRPISSWVNRIDLPYPGTLTAVYSQSLNRDSVFSALENARIYASSDHGRPFINFTINGTKVGDGSTLIAPDSLSHRQINITIAQDGAPAANKRPFAASVTPNWVPDWSGKVEIFKNGVLFSEQQIDKPIEQISILDTNPIVGTSYLGCIEKNGKYYINEFSDNEVNPALLNTNGFDFYVVRVVGTNGRMAYAGPIWVEF